MISDFAVLIAIGLAVLIDAILGLDTPKLNVPNEFRVSTHKILCIVKCDC